MVFRRSIKFQVIFTLTMQLLVLFGVVFTSLYLLKLRQHDYLILNLAGQLRVIVNTMAKQSENYVEYAPRDYKTYERDLGLYHRDLKSQIAGFDKIINAFEARALPGELVSFYYLKQLSAQPPRGLNSPLALLSGDDKVIYCKWDNTSRNQLDDTIKVWREFRRGLLQQLGEDDRQPRLEAAAQYILLNEHDLVLTTTELASSFRTMMESKLSDIELLNKASVLVIFIFGVSLLVLLYQTVFRPIDRTVDAFNRVSRGELRYQIPIRADNEIGRMTDSFNHLARRIATLFRLTDRINQATNLDETLRFVYEEFPAFLPVDWVGLLHEQANEAVYRLERIHSHGDFELNEREKYSLQDSLFLDVVRGKKVACVSTDSLQKTGLVDPFIDSLCRAGLKSAFVMPLALQDNETAALVFASVKECVYSLEHLEFMQNIAAQVSHSFDKTMGMESLVISTVEGLAKLAESRDPETGDHLYRMSRYSALIAEELGRYGKYRNEITPAYVRNVYRFAPMHDIGKVGIGDEILLKPGALTAAEREIMERHPLIGGDVLRRCEQQVQVLGRSIFQIGIEIAEGHHEKYDGSGYPKGLAGEEIFLSARIVAVADVFDALTSKRPYKEAWPVEKALALMQEESGKHFDPEIIAAMERAMDAMMQVYAHHKHV